jgi:hypothetical protein
MDPGLNSLQQEIAEAVAGITPEQLHWHPPGKWCAAEVLEHLYLTYTGTIKGFERLLQARPAATTKQSWKQRVGRLLVLRLSYMPPGRQAPPFARPRGLPAENVLAEIGPKISEMDAMITRCEESLGKANLLDHAILGPLTAAGWRKFHLVHGRHHLNQIRALRRGSTL